LVLNRHVSTVFVQEVNATCEAHFCHYLELGVALLDGFINKDALCVQHLVGKFGAGVGSRVVSKDHSFVSLVDLCFSQHFYQERAAVHKEDPWESANGVPNVGGNRLQRSDDDNVLLLALQIFRPEWKDKVHD